MAFSRLGFLKLDIADDYFQVHVCSLRARRNRKLRLAGDAFEDDFD
jgi:hypothetical protein